jgi:hypothetical protein
MQTLDAHALAQVVGGKWNQKLDAVVSKVYPGWSKLTPTSRAMWVGTAAGSLVGAGGSALTPAVGTAVAPFAGALASTAYLEASKGTATG